MTRGRWGPPASRGRRGCYYCRRDMRSADFPASASPDRAGEGVGLDEGQNPVLDLVRQLGHAVGQLGAVLRDRVTTVLEVADRAVDRALDRPAALTQFALDAYARFAHLALEAVAGGDAAALEATQLRLGLRGRRVGRDGVADARHHAVAGD